jgi:hypothetical protein
MIPSLAGLRILRKRGRLVGQRSPARCITRVDAETGYPRESLCSGLLGTVGDRLCVAFYVVSGSIGVRSLLRESNG